MAKVRTTTTVSTHPTQSDETCGKQLTTKKNVIDHMNTHMGAMTYKCKNCPKTFANPSNRNDHQRTHFDATYECEFCSNKFFTARNRNKHRKSHFDPTYECEFCHQKFYHSSVNVKRHRDGNKQQPAACKVRR